MPDLDPSYAAIVRKLVSITRQIADLTTEADDLKKDLRRALAVGDYTVGGKPVVSVSPTRRFDPVLATQVLPAELLTLVQTTTVDAALARRVLPPPVYAACQKVGANNTIRLV